MLRVLRSSFQIDTRLFVNIRRRSLITTCLCSGFIYRMYTSWNRNKPPSSLNAVFATSLPSDLSATTICIPPGIVFIAEENGSEISHANAEKKEAELRAEKLLSLQKWIENELPATFTRGLFDTLDLFRPETVLEVERTKGQSMFFRGSSRANCFLALVRAYFAAVSSGRRIELLNVSVDHSHWHVEASFRVVLLPPPSRVERDLPIPQLIQRLETRAKWHDFRAIFYVSKLGDLTLVKITRLNPPQKRLFGLSLQKMRLVSSIVPAINTITSGLPQPFSPLFSVDSPPYFPHFQALLEDLHFDNSLTLNVYLLRCLNNSDEVTKTVCPANMHASSGAANPRPRPPARVSLRAPLPGLPVVNPRPYFLGLYSTFSQPLVPLYL
uniref:PAP_RNA-bind domain-containing protein n=1 Tax=Mesocestoides corti TaxID=53468 RepID=A0A5K3EN13_MESCO